MADLREADRRAQEIADAAADHVNQWSQENHEMGGVCDFCCSSLTVDGQPVDGVVTYVLTGDIVSQITGMTEDLGVGVMTMVQDPYWAACKVCDPIIAADDPEALAAHAHDNRYRPVTDRGVEPGRFDRDRDVHVADLVELYRAFYARQPVRHEGEVSG